MNYRITEFCIKYGIGTHGNRSVNMSIVSIVFLKRDGTKSGSVERLTFGNDVMKGYRLAYLTPSDREYTKLNLANVCYKKMVVKAGDHHQLITQDFGKC